jgi:hypothetical protein
MVGVARLSAHEKSSLGAEGESWVLKSEQIKCHDGDTIGCAYDQVRDVYLICKLHRIQQHLTLPDFAYCMILTLSSFFVLLIFAGRHAYRPALLP